MTRPLILLAVCTAIIGAIFFLESRKPSRTEIPDAGTTAVTPRVDADYAKEKSRRYALAHEISTPDYFINTDKITLGELVGKKIILVDFWTYSCINCQRTIPHLNALYEKYKDKGLEIIGVHTPEFEFEKKYDNVLAAVKKFGVQYPVVMDNDFSTWTAYGNRYWPRKYLVDIDGFVVYDHIGEGAYAETEAKIRELLEERATMLGIKAVGIHDTPLAAAENEGGERSPEIYFGAARNEFLGNGATGVTGMQTFTRPRTPAPHTLYLDGAWNITPEYAEVKNAPAHIIFRYRGASAYLVASASHGAIPVKILRDGKPIPAGVRGVDIEEAGGATMITITESRLYHIIEDSERGEHTLELIIESPGLQVFTFTFG